jgi:uncharacterized protein YndB with AHSA1/START domain
MTKDAPTGIERATGRDRPEWFAVLDAWGATGRPYVETSAWLRDAHGLSAWWAQKLTVEYEQARGTRAPGVRRDGTFEVTASKAIAADVARVEAAFTDAATRDRWLGAGVAVSVRAHTAGERIHLDWGTAGERVTATFEAPAPGRTTVAVQHQRLPDTGAAAAAKAAWRDRLAALKSTLEA